MKKYSRVRLEVEGFGDDPSAVTHIIGFPPSSVARCGFSSQAQHTAWLFEVAEPAADDLEGQLAELINTLAPRSDGIHRVALRFPTRIVISVDDRDWVCADDPSGYRSGGFEIAPTAIDLASRLRISLKIHFFSGLQVKAKAFGSDLGSEL